MCWVVMSVVGVRILNKKKMFCLKCLGICGGADVGRIKEVFKEKDGSCS